MTVVYLDELHEEKDVLAVITELENVVIQAITATRNKRKLITNASQQVEMLIKKCAARRWKTAKGDLDRLFQNLEAANAEVTANLWMF